MPAPATCDEFLDAVRESGVVDSRRLADFLGQASIDSLRQQPDKLSEAMVEAGVLTRFQRHQLLQGRRKGFIVADRYLLLDELGAGGMGAVYLCEHVVMRRKVALKVLPADFAKDPEYLDRFHREARAAAALDHPNIVRAHDADRDGKMHFLVMEYIEGCSLHDLVKKEGPVEYRRAADYIAQAAAGLQHAHESGLVHRDIKPANLLVDRKGTVKILDMGLAVFFQEQESLTKQYDANAVLGTADYLAPEQAVDSHNVDIRADIYSLGLTFYFLLTGTNPFGSGTIAQKLLWHQLREVKSVRELRPEVPEGLAAVLSKMIAKDKADRYQEPKDLIAALKPWIDGSGGESAVSPDGDTLVAVTSNAAPTVAETRRDAEAPIAPSQVKRSAPTTGKGSEPAVRTGKVVEPGTRGPRTTKAARTAEPTLTRNGKSAKSDAELTAAKPPSGKNPRSGKGKRSAKERAGFWDLPRIIVASVLGPLGVIVLGLFGWSLTQPSATAPVKPKQITQAPPPAIPGPAQTATPTPPPPAKTTPPTPTPPPMPPTKTEPPKTTPTPMPMPMPPTKTEPPKTTPTPMPMPMPPTKTEPPKTTTPDAKPRSLADYFPKSGETRFYDIAAFAPDGSKNVIRQRWDFKTSGIIDVTTIRVGMLEGDSLLGGGSIRWTGPLQQRQRLNYRTDNNVLEVGATDRRAGAVLWEPTLPLSAAVGDTGNWRLPTGDAKNWTVTKFDTFKNKPAVVIRSSVLTAPDTHLVTVHTFVEGLGEVRRVVQSEKKGEAPKLLGEVRLVDD